MSNTIRKSPIPEDEAVPDLVRRYVDTMREELFSCTTIARHERCLKMLCRSLDAECIALNDLDVRTAQELVDRTAALKRLQIRPSFIAERFVGFLVEQGLSTPPVAAQADDARIRLRHDYESYLRQERGLRDATINSSWRWAVRFLDFRFEAHAGDLSAIKPEDLVQFLQHLIANRRSPLSECRPPSHLKNFFRYLYRAGMTQTDIAAAIPNMRRSFAGRLRRYLLPEQVELLLAAIRAGSPRKVRRRNYAMILLQARLGLRAPEVLAIQVDDIDWRRGEITIRGKGGLHDRLPLPPDVGEALVDYLRFERPAASLRILFITAKAPYRSFLGRNVLVNILRHAFALTGLTPPAPFVGTHMLRHSLASHMARQGASLGEIGDLLRHRSPASTLIYAKLDIESLRSIAQPWPARGDV